MVEISPNPNWARWIFASLSVHFVGALAPTPVHVEGQYRDTRTLPSFIELRIDGPFCIQPCRGFWQIKSEVSLLIQSVMTDTDFHGHLSLIGLAQSSFAPCITIYRYGKNVQDDKSVLGQMRLLQNKSSLDYVEGFNFGQIDKDKNLLQGTAEGHYLLELTT